MPNAGDSEAASLVNRGPRVAVSTRQRRRTASGRGQDPGRQSARYDAARVDFSDHELACLSAAIATINVWNRFMVAYRFPPDIE